MPGYNRFNENFLYNMRQSFFLPTIKFFPNSVTEVAEYLFFDFQVMKVSPKYFPFPFPSGIFRIKQIYFFKVVGTALLKKILYFSKFIGLSRKRLIQRENVS